MGGEWGRVGSGAGTGCPRPGPKRRFPRRREPSPPRTRLTRPGHATPPLQPGACSWRGSTARPSTRTSVNTRRPRARPAPATAPPSHGSPAHAPTPPRRAQPHPSVSPRHPRPGSHTPRVTRRESEVRAVACRQAHVAPARARRPHRTKAGEASVRLPISRRSGSHTPWTPQSQDSLRPRGRKWALPTRALSPPSLASPAREEMRAGSTLSAARALGSPTSRPPPRASPGDESPLHHPGARPVPPADPAI
ncbi:hypothetical protein HNR73_000599 [Phytomonospora endophytica]|uniref:Uncharacterized protein n=1 Tax=Phytomonospora endophytica TaxID=714109 RepID=A0A841FI18_9ACTN|nr:hypothetical protein [Phytomonospora endophytica]